MQIIQSPSKNSYSRQGYKPELIVIHCTDGFFPGDLNWLRNTSGQSQVSSHYVISPAGAVHQLVDDSLAAWHAGRDFNPTARLLKKNSLGSIINANFYSIGIEISLKPPVIAPAVQWQAIKELVQYLATKHGIPLDRDHIIGHKEIFGKKTCPGTINVDQLVAELQPKPPVPPPAPEWNKEEYRRTIINFIKNL